MIFFIMFKFNILDLRDFFTSFYVIFIHPYNHIFIYSSIHSFIHSFIHPSIHSFILSSNDQLIHLVHLLIHPCIESSIHLFILPPVALGARGIPLDPCVPVPAGRAQPRDAEPAEDDLRQDPRVPEHHGQAPHRHHCRQPDLYTNH